jgi:hypothetical protein
MYRREPFPVKKICLWFMVFILGLGVLFVIFVSILSIKIGLNHLSQDGFIIPVLAGIFSIVVCLFLFICFIRFIISLLKEKDIIRSS